MRKWLIAWLYNGLDDWAKWEVYKSLKCPTIDDVMLEQCKQHEKIFGK